MFLLYKSNHGIPSVLALLQLIDFTYSVVVTDPKFLPKFTNPDFLQTLGVPVAENFQTGPNFLGVFHQLSGEFHEAANSESIEPITEYEKVANPHQLSFGEDSESSGKLKENLNLQENAQYLLSKTTGIDTEEILNAGETMTEKYKLLVSKGDAAGNYALLINGEGSDVASSAMYISMVKKSPKGIILRPKDKKPSFDLEQYNLGLKAMESDSHFGNVECPDAILASDDSYKGLAEKMKKAISETREPFVIVVYGSGQPILDLMKEEGLMEKREDIIFVHIGVYFWNELPEQAGSIRWKLGQNVLGDPEVEKKILELGIQRLAIHSGASRPENLVNIIDKDEAGLRLKADPNVNLHSTGALSGVKAFFLSDSPSGVGKHLGESMKTANMHISEKEIMEQEAAKLGHTFFGNLKRHPNELNRRAAMEGLRMARDIYKTENPETQILKLGDKDMEVVAFWNKVGSQQLEKTCEKFPKYEREHGSISILENLKARDFAFLAQEKPKFYTGDPYHKNLMVALIAMAHRDQKLSFHMHASEAQAILAASSHLGGKEDQIPFFGVPVVYNGPKQDLNKDNFDLKFDKTGGTVVVLGVDDKALLKACQKFFKTPTTAVHSSN